MNATAADHALDTRRTDQGRNLVMRSQHVMLPDDGRQLSQNNTNNTMKKTKTETKQWTMNSRQIVADDRYISARFKGDVVYNGRLDQLVEFARTNNLDVPLECNTPEGRHGLFPCIIASDRRIQIGLSALVGYRVELHDGVTFPSRSSMRRIARGLHSAGIPLPATSLVWAVTDQPYADSKPAPKMLQHVDDAIPF